MSIPHFPHPLDDLPRPGRREIRMKPADAIPRIRNERMPNDDRKESAQ